MSAKKAKMSDAGKGLPEEVVELLHYVYHDEEETMLKTEHISSIHALESKDPAGEEGFKFSFSFGGGEESQSYEGFALKHKGKWFLSPKAPVPGEVIDRARAAVVEHMKEELEVEQDDTDSEALTMSHALWTDFEKDEEDVADTYDFCFRFHSDEVDHGLWCGVNIDKTGDDHTYAYSFN